MDKQPSSTLTVLLVMKNADGRSILDAEGPITADNINQFALAPTRVAEIQSQVEAYGFAVEQSDANTLSLAGPKELFLDVFGLELGAVASAGKSHAAVIPDNLRPSVAAVFVPTAPEFFP